MAPDPSHSPTPGLEQLLTTVGVPTGTVGLILFAVRWFARDWLALRQATLTQLQERASKAELRVSELETLARAREAEWDQERDALFAKYERTLIESAQTMKALEIALAVARAKSSESSPSTTSTSPPR